MEFVCKVQLFCWRALHGIIPLKSILANRHVGTDGTCPICKQGPEDIKHLMFTCGRAMDLWNALGISQVVMDVLHIDRSGSVIFYQFLLQTNKPIQCMPTVSVHEIIAIGGWYLWWLRRQTTHNESVPPMSKWPLSILGIAAHAARACRGNQVNSQIRWTKPNPGFVKLNVDASYHAEEGTGATTAFIRDLSGKFLAGRCTFYLHAADAVTMEATAMKEGLILANSMGFHRVTAESDSTEVINVCTWQSQWWEPSILA